MSAKKKSVEFYYDVLSPYSWLGFEIICRYEQRWNIDLQLKPFLVSAVMTNAGTTTPAANKTRAEHLKRDVIRNGIYYKVPMALPADFLGGVLKKGSLSAQRLLTVVRLYKPDILEDLTRALWLRVWSKDLDITETSSLLEACKSIGLTDEESQSLLEKIQEKDVKDALQEVTDEAINFRAFGAPTFMVECQDGKKRMIFGSDRFYLMADMLGEKYEGPLNELAK